MLFDKLRKIENLANEIKENNKLENICIENYIDENYSQCSLFFELCIKYVLIMGVSNILRI